MSSVGPTGPRGVIIGSPSTSKSQGPYSAGMSGVTGPQGANYVLMEEDTPIRLVSMRLTARLNWANTITYHVTTARSDGDRKVWRDALRVSMENESMVCYHDDAAEVAGSSHRDLLILSLCPKDSIPSSELFNDPYWDGLISRMAALIVAFEVHAS